MDLEGKKYTCLGGREIFIFICVKNMNEKSPRKSQGLLARQGLTGRQVEKNNQVGKETGMSPFLDTGEQFRLKGKGDVAGRDLLAHACTCTVAYVSAHIFALLGRRLILRAAPMVNIQGKDGFLRWSRSKLTPF